ncbi:MAG: RNA 2',3'-cyclic phosphodiesterase [Methylobacter sp.]
MQDTSRLFFALWPDNETRLALTRFTQSMTAGQLKWVQPHNLHVTLVFLGSVDTNTESLIKQTVADISVQPFTLTFDSLSYWNKPGILCLTCRQSVPEEAVMLASALSAVAAACGLQTDIRPYTPHITLARHARHLPDIAVEPIAWHAEAFCLIESCSEPDGVRYEVVQRWPFIKPTVNPDRSR